MNTPPERTWNGVSAEDRRAERRLRLIEAGVEIMGTQGAQAVTVRAVCRAMHISERHYYQLFDSKDEFLLAVYDHVVEEALSSVGAASAIIEVDQPAALRHFTGLWIDFVVADPRYGRIIAVEAARSKVLAQRGRQVATTMLQIFLTYAGGGGVGSESVGRNDADLEITATILVTGFWGLLLAWLDGTLMANLDRDELIERVVALVLRALPPVYP
ncbi:TetR/AcrR family transcriptional regulator [Nocardia sp. NPDC004654]|uniref:TetR/AcrR family transcriptional regulator n=1 Tax=Nocardia sp. NPDC004654 TaxID=3154776 RepID=UPI0033A32411